LLGGCLGHGGKEKRVELYCIYCTG
jgi:hypothetical protein